MKHRGKSGMRRFTKLIGIVLIAFIGFVAAGIFFGFNPMTSSSDWPLKFRSNGERIYFTAASASGLPISPNGSGMHMSMMGGGCVTCHGADRQGGRMMPRFWKIVPPLTPAALFGDHEKGEKDDGHGGHDVYTDETLGRAITRGIDPGGKPLDVAMPRWSISAQDLGDLIAHLKSPVDKAR